MEHSLWRARRPLPARRAHELALVNRLTPSGGALAAALEIARDRCQRTARRPLVQAGEVETQDVSLAEAFALQEPLMQIIRSSEDAAEGARAFVEKRRPRWVGAMTGVSHRHPGTDG
jgi:enoyl-CoA hydratase/carnithine racemase